MRLLHGGISLALLSCVTILPALSATITVSPRAGTPLGDAITAAKPGDTIVVQAGTYSEQVTIGSGLCGLSLIAAGNVTLAGATPNDPGSTGITVMANGVTIKGFTVQNYGTGISLTNSAVVSENTLTGNSSAGININAVGCEVEHNTITNNLGSGVVIQGNSITYLLAFSTIEHNTITKNGSGIYLQDSADQVIAHNTITGNSIGIDIEDFNYSVVPNKYADTISHNTITANLHDGIQLAAGANMTFDYNDIDNNGTNGIEVQAGSFGNIFNHESAHGNGLSVTVSGPFYDAQDETGSTLSTLTNTWMHDSFGTSNPPNLGQ